MAFLTSLESILSIILIILLGYILKEKKWFDDSFSNNISKLIMNIALPASIFVSVLKYLTVEKLISLSGGLIYTFLSVIIGYIIAWIMVKILKVKPGRRGTFINTIVNANTIFIGLPLNIALFERFIMSPCIMVVLIILGAKISGTMPALESKTYIIQASAPALAVLPILANESNGDVKYATNVVTTSTVLFAIVVAIITSLFK